MVSLGNQARLLAAQAFNKAVLERKARERLAKINRERAEDLAKLRGITSARAVQKRREIEAKAKRESARAFSRVSKGSNIGVLTGFKARKDTRGRAIGISRTESATRKNTKALLIKEIQRQRDIANKETDLERFLKNERRLNAGQISFSELRRQIAKRKARGLSKTPAQKRAFFRLRDQEDIKALQARNRRKQARGLKGSQITDPRVLLARKRSEADRAGELGSLPFVDPLFAFGGRTKKQVIARGGTFGRRVGGESISSQLSFINRAKSRSTSGRISFAQGLLSNLNFEGSSQNRLLSIVGSQTKDRKTGRLTQIRLAPKTFQQELRAGVGFFTTVQAPVTKPKLTKAGRGKLVRARKLEDIEKTQKARSKIALTKALTTQRQVSRADDLDRISANLLSENIGRGREIEAQNLARPPRFSGQFTLRQQAQDPTQLSLIPTRSAFAGTSVERVAKGQKLTPSQKRRQAEARQRETQLLRDTPFVSGGLVPATGRPSSTETFFPDIPSPDRNIFNVSLSENIGISDRLSPTPVRSTSKRGKKTTRPPRDQFDVLNPAGLIAPAPRQPSGSPTPRDDPFADIFGGVGEALGQTGGRIRGAVGGLGEVFGGVGETFGNFLAIGRESGGTDLLSEAASFDNLFGAGESLASGSFFGQFDVDPNFDPAEAGRRTAEQVL